MNILVLTSIYPEPDDDKKAGVTPVVHDFAKIWAARGHRVVVIHNANKYPVLLHMLPKRLKKKINSTVGMVLPTIEQRRDLVSEREGVTVVRFPMLKVVPNGRFSNGSIKRQYGRIMAYLNRMQFAPDLMIGHWENPQIPLLAMLKRKFGCRSALVFHTLLYIRKRSCRGWLDYLKDIDALGCRSKTMAAELKKLVSLPYDPFVCYSGVPDKYVAEVTAQRAGKFADGAVTSFIYAGRYTRQKHIGSVIQALHAAYPQKDFRFDIVGVDASVPELSSVVNSLGLQEQVRFLGRKPRAEVIELMKGAQCFIMVSENEAFGLVYLEALACGCITIGSRGEGVDGVIEHGQNGFLCGAGNAEELAALLAEINAMPARRKEELSASAISTAIRFKESDVAIRYLRDATGGREGAPGAEKA